MRFDLAHPTQHQLRDGVTCGFIAESIMIPILITVTFVDHHSVRWGFVFGAMACIFVSVVYLAIFVAVTKGRSSAESQANVWFVIVCLALAGLAFIELATSTHTSLYTPAMLVGVIFVCIVGDRRMQVVIDLYAIALISLIGWIEGLRGGDFLVWIVVYASTIVVITFICALTVGSLTGQVNFSHAIDTLNESFDDFGFDGTRPGSDTFSEIFRCGLPQVTHVLPALRVAVFTRNRTLERFTLLASWPDEVGDCSDLAHLPALTRALVSNAVDLEPRYCAIPVGYCADGELVMVVQRSDRRTAGSTSGLTRRPSCWPRPSSG